MTRRPPTRPLALVAALAIVPSACGGDDDPSGDEPPYLDPEPAGAPDGEAGGRLSCLGDNDPGSPSGPNLTLPGWVRTYEDPGNTGGAQPSAQVEAFDETRLSLGTAFSDTDSGRVAVTVPVPARGFTGKALVTADGYLDQHFFSSRPYTDTATAAWVWLFSADERDTAADAAGVTVDPDAGIVVGAVHDCDVFGVSNAIVTWDERTDGVVYFDVFDPVAGRTFTSVSGRFAIPNVPPGPVAVEAWGRAEPGGALVLLSRADVEVVAGAVTAVDLEPRVGVDR